MRVFKISSCLMRVFKPSFVDYEGRPSTCHETYITVICDPAIMLIIMIMIRRTTTMMVLMMIVMRKKTATRAVLAILVLLVQLLLPYRW
jgi:hypothetical protein